MARCSLETNFKTGQKKLYKTQDIDDFYCLNKTELTFNGTKESEVEQKLLLMINKCTEPKPPKGTPEPAIPAPLICAT
jgi:hypothetical protein